MKDHQECLFLDGTLSEAIRDLVRRYVSYRRLQRQTGIDIASITRFAQGYEVRSSTLDKLAEHFELGISKRPKKAEAKNESAPLLVQPHEKPTIEIPESPNRNDK